jgi:hypothetical protein
MTAGSKDRIEVLQTFESAGSPGARHPPRRWLSCVKPSGILISLGGGFM